MIRRRKVAADLEIGIVETRVQQDLAREFIGAERHVFMIGRVDEGVSVVLDQLATQRDAGRV